MRLVLLRHGQTAWNHEGRAQGQTDVPLDDTGLLQAKRVAPLIADLAPALLWTSDLARARMTADEVAETTGLALRTDSRLREYAVGENRSGLTFAEYAEQFPAEAESLRAGRPEDVPGRETDQQVVDRYLPAISEAAAQLTAGQTGVLVSHGAAIRTATIALLGGDVALAQGFGGLDNCHWVEFEMRTSHWDGSGAAWRMTAWNRG